MCICCSFLILIVVACLAGAALFVCLKFFGPEARLTRAVVLKETDQTNGSQLLSPFPQFCDNVNATLKYDFPNISVTMYIATEATEEALREECPLEFDNWCILDIPLDINSKLYVRTEFEDKSNANVTLSLDCTTRVWLYVVLSLSTVFLFVLVMSICLCCWARVCCRNKKVEQGNNLFIYTPLLNSADRGPDTRQEEHSLIVGSVNTPDGVVPTLHPTELSTSYKYSSFKPGTKPGGSIRRKHHVRPKKQQSPKPTYATISGTYTVNTFKPED